MSDWQIANGHRLPAVTRKRIGTGLYAEVVDALGQEIIDAVLPAGTLIYADQICERFEVSRSVVREGIRTLGAMGLVEARPQVGTRVQPSTEWDLLNPNVVKWRALGPSYLEQMQQLLELRLGVEHAAAGLAARRLTHDKASEILDRAVVMREAYRRGDAKSFFEADATFHRLVLEGTENAMIARLSDTISMTLDVRSHDTRPGMLDLNLDAVDMHVHLAEALVAADVDRSQALALRLVQVTIAGFERTQAGTVD